MQTVLVTGVSGAGKSALARRLVALGYSAVSTDGADGLCRWVDQAGRRVDRPSDPDMRWLASHRWVWDPTRLDAIIAGARAGGAPLLWVCGSAANTNDLADRFDLVVGLRIDLDTMLARLGSPSRGNDFGRAGQTREHLRARFDDWAADVDRQADVTVDATGDLDSVVAELLRAAREQCPGRPTGLSRRH